VFLRLIYLILNPSQRQLSGVIVSTLLTLTLRGKQNKFYIYQIVLLIVICAPYTVGPGKASSTQENYPTGLERTRQFFFVLKSSVPTQSSQDKEIFFGRSNPQIIFLSGN
jgi:hypothetical protein